ncbi:helix-turn-helix transcriptional regulator [Micromonospora sp. NPDC000207]|uniref:helix-turn-helix domain-containing protein n=1 Tax=Micromonospora sp. NPDC000207 TaxID=3154246 RepID=UPI0033281832
MVNAGERKRPTLGELVRARRESLGLSQNDAADMAGVSRGTWANVEADARKTQPHNYAGIEQVLQWEPGSIRLVNDGGEPVVAAPDVTLDRLEEKVRAISANPARSEPLRRWAASVLDQIQQLREADEIEARRQRGA